MTLHLCPGSILRMRKLEPSVWAAFLQWIEREAATRGYHSRDAIAEASGIAGSTLGRWAAAENGPTLGAVAAVADALGLSMAQMGAGLDLARNPDGISGSSAQTETMTIDRAILVAVDLDDHERGPVSEAVSVLLRAMRHGPGGKIEVTRS